MSWYEEEETPEISLSGVTQRKAHMRTRQEGAICKLGREVSPEVNSAGTLILDL